MATAGEHETARKLYTGGSAANQRTRRRFKIQEEGYSNGVWATSKVIDNAGKHAIKIPDCLEDGQYLLRAEMIALHAAGSAGGAQLYVRRRPRVEGVRTGF